MHSPVWHIDMQTFNNDKPLIARDKRFRVYKCGVYLQDESVDGGGTLEVRQPYAGGGIKNFLYTGNYKKLDIRVIHLVVKALGIFSDSLQMFGKSLGLKGGDLVIFSGALKHRASQKRHNQSILQDFQFGHFVDMSDKFGKIMLQWEFVNESVFGYEYRDHAILKHKLLK